MPGRTWFVTGASRGIGAEVVEAALAAGDRVAATGRSTESLVARFGQREGLLCLQMDVTDEAAIARAVANAIAHFGHLDIVLNNAGYGMLGTLEETTMKEFRACVETNFFGTVLVCKAVLPHLRRRRAGHIINVTSCGAFNPVEGFSAYCSAKFAVEGLSDVLRREIEPLGIHLTAVEPGYVRSEFCGNNSMVIVPEIVEDYAHVLAIRRTMEAGQTELPGDPAKVAAAIVKMTQAKKPPRWLPLGSDAVSLIETKQAAVQQDINDWRELACSTHF